jgi:hypothetical protein
MAEKQYLYGAAVQGIQSFIFQTNELKDIVGASELVEQICTSVFDKYANNGESILSAAGNIKFIFKKKADCERAVLNFPREVMTMAPGITISQAVVPFISTEANGTDTAFENAVESLEKKLRAQRNKPMQSITMGLTGVKRSPKTGLPGVCYDKKNGPLTDEATLSKRSFNQLSALCEKSFGVDFKKMWPNGIAYDITDITGKNDWIAIIHVDGNGLGQVVQKVGKDKSKFKEFSDGLDCSTKSAAHSAFAAVEKKFEGKKVIPIRPVVLGGDDMTAICRADIALDYTKAFIEAFEKETQSRLGEILRENNVFNGRDKLTACAGIAFIKSSYPFYYGYRLAEALCDRAKKDAKDKKRLEDHDNLAPSCLMFHKVQDSFVEKFEEIAKRELTPSKDYSFEYGPYYIKKEDDHRWTVDELVRNVSLLDGEDGNAVKSDLRKWMSEMHKDPEAAKQRAKRALSLMKKKTEKDIDLYKMFEEVTNATNNIKKSPAYDMLSLFTVINQVTKEELNNKK